MELSIRAEKAFGNFRLTADFRASGDRIGIFGPSGGGKSTLTRLIAGLETPEQGEIVLNDSCLFSSSRRINLAPEKRRIAVVFQQACLFPHLNVRNNLLYGYRRTPQRQRSIDFDELVRILGLDGLLERGVNHLSGGEKQRVALGRAILSHPQLLLMDEPLSALDDTLRFAIIPYLRSVSASFGIPYLFISHSLLEMRLMTEAALGVANGQVAALLPVEELARRQLDSSPEGYRNLLELDAATADDGLWSYRWGERELIVSDTQSGSAGVFELPAKAITLCKRHPEATSARNLIPCRVSGFFRVGNRVGVELDCGGARLVSQVVAAAASELDLQVGSDVIAMIKASAFRRLY